MFWETKYTNYISHPGRPPVRRPPQGRLWGGAPSPLLDGTRPGPPENGRSWGSRIPFPAAGCLQGTEHGRQGALWGESGQCPSPACTLLGPLPWGLRLCLVDPPSWSSPGR